MESFFDFMSVIIDFMKTPFSLWGFETSMWGIFLFVIVGSLVIHFIGGVFDI